MTVVIGTAGHIDHGKTTLLRALTGIDADRLPEERRRGMTIDVGYAHLALDDGTELDLIDVPGHDRLVGNMLVGAGEIDAALLVVAADDGPRAQTMEHVALLDGLDVRDGVVALTKVDTVPTERVEAVRASIEALLGATSLAGSPVVPVSAVTGAGVGELRDALVAMRDRVVASQRLAGGTGGARGPATATPSLAIDRVFSQRGRGLVVTGTLRGGEVDRGVSLRTVPGDATVRIREIQVHGQPVERAGPGRVALNLGGIDGEALHRGVVLTTDEAVVASDRWLVALAHPVADRWRARLHAGTAAEDAVVGRGGRDAIDLPDGRALATLRIASPLAVRAGDRFVLRRPEGPDAVVGGLVLDPRPARGVSRRRQTPARVGALLAAVESRADVERARLDLHGALVADGVGRAAADIVELALTTSLSVVDPEASLAATRIAVATAVRRAATLRRDEAALLAMALVRRFVEADRLVRSGDRLRRPGAAAAPTVDPTLGPAMDRLERALAVPAPAGLDDAARAAGCPPAGIRELERSGRIVVLEPGLAYAAATYRVLTDQARALAAEAPLTPAAFRDATGTSRKYVMAILEDLDRRGVLRRTDAGHVPGPRA